MQWWCRGEEEWSHGWIPHYDDNTRHCTVPSTADIFPTSHLLAARCATLHWSIRWSVGTWWWWLPHTCHLLPPTQPQHSLVTASCLPSAPPIALITTYLPGSYVHLDNWFIATRRDQTNIRIWIIWQYWLWTLGTPHNSFRTLSVAAELLRAAGAGPGHSPDYDITDNNHRGVTQCPPMLHIRFIPGCSGV